MDETTQLLYRWYSEEFAASDQFVRRTRIRELLGYEGTALVPGRLPMDEFLLRLRRSWRDASVKQAWIDRFAAGHDEECRGLPVDVRAFLEDCTRELPASLREADGGRNLRAS